MTATTQPYIVMHTQLPEHDGATGAVLYREAFATLEEARQAAFDRCPDALDLAEQCEALGEFQDAVPLLGGSVIEVQRIEWAGVMSVEAIQLGLYDESLAVWNAKYGIGIEGITHGL